MKCSLCGTDLIPGNNACPSCGALNMDFANNASSTPEQAAPQSAPVQEQIEVMPTETQTLEVSQQAQVAPTQESVPQGQMNSDGIIAQNEDLDAGPAEVVTATADMAAPTLEVQTEDLESGAKELTDSANVSTYNPEEQVEAEAPAQAQTQREADLDIAIPEAQAPEAVKLDENGMQQVELTNNTAGVVEEPVKTKFSLKVFKQKSLPRNLVLILLVIVLIIGILMGSTLFAKQVYVPGNTKNTKKDNNIVHVSDGKNNTTYVGKYIYKIPDTYDYDKYNGGIVVYDKDDSYRISIKAVQGNYEQIANAKDSIKRSLEGIKTTVNSVIETTINDTSYVVIEGNTSNRNRIYAIRNGNNDNVFYVEVVTNDNEYNYKTLEIANDIINNAEYKDSRLGLEGATFEDLGSMISAIGTAYNS